MPLQTAGLLCALIFVISSIFEVLSLNHLYVTQHGLIALLLETLAVWALIEVNLSSRSDRSQPLRSLRLLLGLQIGLIAARHWNHFSFQPRANPSLLLMPTAPEFSQGIVNLLINLLLFLAISNRLITAFSTAERLRANQLQEQNHLLRRTQQELRASQERQQLLEQQQRTQLEQKLKTSLGAAAVVHEIQQPLSAILLNCHSICDWLEELPAGSISEKLHANLHQLSSDADRVVVNIERMRMLLRNVETEQSPIDICANILDGLLFLKNDLADARVQPQLEGLEEPCMLVGDGAQLQIAVVNLIRNALQAMEMQRSASRQLLLQLHRHNAKVEVHVADSGPGFPAGYSNDTSWGLLKSTKASGMGIGLFIAQTAAANHRGRLRIGRSARLGGAEVVIELPLPVGLFHQQSLAVSNNKFDSREQ